MIPELRNRFNQAFSPEAYQRLLQLLEQRCGSKVGFRVAETPIFVPFALLDEMAASGANLTRKLMSNPAYMAAARQAIPEEYRVAGETAHPNFLTADFGLVLEETGKPAPKLVEIQAFPSVYGYQDVLSSTYKEAFRLPDTLGCFLGGMDEAGYWDLLAQTVLGAHDPENVVLTELDPLNQKTLPDFKITARQLGIAVVDIRSLEPIQNRLNYRSNSGKLVPIHRIFNRAIADELIARKIRLPFDWTQAWDVEWAGHPNWYFLISKFSIPWLSTSSGLSGSAGGHPVVPPAVFVSDFLEGDGFQRLARAAVPLPSRAAQANIYSELLLKPLFSFAGKGIEFGPSQSQLEAIPAGQRANFLVQQRMRFEPTIETPHGLTQAEIRILYLWPDAGKLTPALSLVRLGRGKMMGVDHNKNQEWVGASAAFFPNEPTSVSK